MLQCSWRSTMGLPLVLSLNHQAVSSFTDKEHYSPERWNDLARCLEQEQSRLYGHLWRSDMESLSAMTVMSSARSRLRCSRNTLKSGQNAQNHKSGHLDKDPIRTLMWVGPRPLVDHKNSERWPPNAQAWLCQWYRSDPSRTSIPPLTCCLCGHLAWGWGQPLYLQIWPVTGTWPQARSAHF